MIDASPLRFHGVAFAYGARRGVEQVDLTIERGEICTLIGHNGAGKSTLIRLACGRLRPQAGAVRVFGRDPALDPEARDSIGFAPQDLALFAKLTTRENLAAFAAFGSGPKGDRRAAIERALRRAHADTIADRLVESLSGGEKRRANVAAALLREPRLLILDEPTVGVDAESRAVIHGAVRSICEDGAAVLVSTHDMDEAESLAARVALMSDGRLVRSGRPRTLLEEAFGADAMEVTALVAEGSASATSALRRLGLRPDAAGTRWRAIVSGRDGARLLERELSRDGDVVEVRLRRAGLGALLASATGEAGASLQ